MSDPINYTNLSDRPYNDFLERPVQAAESQQYFNNTGNYESQPIKSDGSMADIWIRNFIRSENWQPKSVGFYINGISGYAEFTNVYISGDIHALTGEIGGFIIGATDLSVNDGVNETIISSEVVAFSAGPIGAPSVYITQAGALFATSGIIGATTITPSALIGGLIETAVSGARVAITSSTNRMEIYDSGNNLIAFFGGLGVTGGIVNINSAANGNLINLTNTNASVGYPTVVFNSNSTTWPILGLVETGTGPCAIFTTNSTNVNNPALGLVNTAGGYAFFLQGHTWINGIFNIYFNDINAYLYADASTRLKYVDAGGDKFVVRSDQTIGAAAVAAGSIRLSINGTSYDILYK